MTRKSRTDLSSSTSSSPETACCRRLWASVVRKAADDLFSKNGDRDKARAWFASESIQMGSFIWCCDVVDLNHEAVRDSIKNGSIMRSKEKYSGLIRMFKTQMSNHHRDPGDPDEAED